MTSARNTTRLIIVSLCVLLSGAFLAYMIIGTALIATGELDPLDWRIWTLLTIAAVTATYLSISALRKESRRRLDQAREDPRRRLSRRLEHVNAAFIEAQSLMEDLRRDLEAQQAAREVLVAQADEQQKLLEIDKTQAEKIREILVGETKETIRTERRQQWLFFILGVAVSIPIGVAINVLVP